VSFAATILVAACGTATTTQQKTTPSMTGMPGMNMDDMAGMSAAPTAAPLAEAAPAGTGLTDHAGGYTLAAAPAVVPGGKPSTFTFHITGPNGRAVTRYQPYQSKLLLFDLIRADLTSYRHFDTAMREDGTWNVTLPALPPGTYRDYVSFAAPDASAGKPLVYVLSTAFTVPGKAGRTPPATATTTGGYTVTVAGKPKAGVRAPLTIGFTHAGQPVTYFQRYLDGYAHVTAFHEGDLAFAHLTPAAKTAGAGTLTTEALFPARGTWRLFVQFQTDGPPRTTAFTVEVG
jgi:hypothetical protein